MGFDVIFSLTCRDAGKIFIRANVKELPVNCALEAESNVKR